MAAAVLDQIEEGARLHAIYAADGEYYPAVVKTVSKSKGQAKRPVKVQYVGYDEEAWVSLAKLKSKRLGLAAPEAKDPAPTVAKAKAKATERGEKTPDFSDLTKDLKLQVKAEDDGKYYIAEVVAVSQKRQQVKIHWVGYTAASDEWVAADRIRSKHLKWDSPKAKAPDFSELTKDLKIQAQAEDDGRYYIAEVVTASQKRQQVKIHWVGYTKDSDEWVTADRIRSKHLKWDSPKAAAKAKVPKVSVLVVGGGGREHAIALKLRESRKVKHVFCAPGNGGTLAEKDMTNLEVSDSDVDALVKVAKEKGVALVFVGPEAPLVAGLADACLAAGIPCFGPSKMAAELEASKAFSKEFFAKHGLPTATFKNFKAGEYEAATQYVQAEYAAGRELVIKASGLAAGKGVLMPESLDEAKAAVKEVMVDKAFGAAGDEVVIEQLLSGEEVSCMAFADGKVASMMLPAQDHKRADDGDQGLNTGGMGAYAPAPCLTPKLSREVEAILQRTVEAMASEGRKYIGCLYGGFMLTRDGPMLLEYNCRFGDPETEVLLPLLKSDLFDVALGCAEGNLPARVPEVVWKKSAAATVVCAAKGYPGSYPKGLLIKGVPAAGAIKGVKVYHAGTKQKDADLVSSGGRVLTVTGLGPDFRQALKVAYEAVEKLSFETPGEAGSQKMHFRRDIGRKALERPTRVAIIGSTRGSSSQATIDAVKAGSINAQVVVAVSNKSDAGILDRAKGEGILAVHVGCPKGTPRAEYDAKVTAVLRDHSVDLVMLVGFMRIVSPEFCKEWAGACINVHPSLLPLHAGGMDLEVHSAVLAAGESESGCTVHMVTEQVDGGAIAVQRKVPVVAGDTPESLKAKVQAEEGPALLEAVRLFGEGKLPK